MTKQQAAELKGEIERYADACIALAESECFETDTDAEHDRVNDTQRAVYAYIDKLEAACESTT